MATTGRRRPTNCSGGNDTSLGRLPVPRFRGSSPKSVKGCLQEQLKVSWAIATKVLAGGQEEGKGTAPRGRTYMHSSALSDSVLVFYTTSIHKHYRHIRIPHVHGRSNKRVYMMYSKLKYPPRSTQVSTNLSLADWRPPKPAILKDSPLEGKSACRPPPPVVMQGDPSGQKLGWR